MDLLAAALMSFAVVAMSFGARATRSRDRTPTKIILLTVVGATCGIISGYLFDTVDLHGLQWIFALEYILALALMYHNWWIKDQERKLQELRKRLQK